MPDSVPMSYLPACPYGERDHRKRLLAVTSQDGVTQEGLIQEHYNKLPSPYFPRGYVKSVIKGDSREECSVLETSRNRNVSTAVKETAVDH